MGRCLIVVTVRGEEDSTGEEEAAVLLLKIEIRTSLDDFFRILRKKSLKLTLGIYSEELRECNRNTPNPDWNEDKRSRTPGS